MIENLKAGYPGLSVWQDEVKVLASQKLYSETWLGRRRYLPNINSDDWGKKSFAERCAMNTPIQGTAADILKMGCARILAGLQERPWLKPILQIHDELTFIIPEAAIAFCRELEAAGYYAGIYSSTYSGFRDRLDDSKLTPFTHWVAQYASKCEYSGAYGIWQYSSSGRVNGINGNVDMDISYQDYPSIIKAGGFNGYQNAGSSQLATPQPIAPVQPRKSVDELAREVLEGKWGNGTDRQNRITSAGYDYAAVQAKVNGLLKAQSRPQAVYYTVQRGDTLSAIARKYGTTVTAIQKLNSSLIRNVNRIQAGWKIRVK